MAGKAWILWGIGGILAGLLAAGAAWWLLTPREVPTPPRVLRFLIDLPLEAPLAQRGNPLAFSRDGAYLVFAAQGSGASRLFVRSLDEFESRPLPNTDGAYSPFFSPDGSWIGYFDARDAKLKKILRTGGEPVTICPAPFGLGAAWTPEDLIVFSPDSFSGLMKVPAGGGAPEPLTNLEDQEFTHRWPALLPDGETVMFTAGMAGTPVHARTASVSLRSGMRRILLENASQARYADSGSLVFLRDNALAAIPFDSGRLEAYGSAAGLVPDLAIDQSSWAGSYALAGNGMIAYATRDSNHYLRSLVWADGHAVPTRAVVSRGLFSYPRFAPDGQRLALVIQSEENRSEVWIANLANGSFSLLTSGGSNTMPVWTPDGERVVFASDRGGQWSLFWMPADGSAPAELLHRGEHPQLPTGCSPDGRYLAFTEFHPSTRADIWIMPLHPGGRAEPFLRTGAAEWGLVFSPDGRQVAYASDEGGLNHVYAAGFPRPASRWQVSTAEGTEPVWAPAGHEIYFRSIRGLMAAPIPGNPEDPPGPARRILRDQYAKGAFPLFQNYDISPDGNRFLMVFSDRPANTRIHVELNRLISGTGAITSK